MSNHDDAVFVRNFTMVLVGLAVVGVMAFILAKIVNRSYESTLTTSDTVASRVEPVGQVNTSGEAVAMEPPPVAAAEEAPAAAAAAPADTATADSGNLGESTYNQICTACHAQGIAGAPKYGDMAAWEARLAKGRDANVANAINGYVGDAGMMPAKGGNPSLSDDAVAAAVDYMLAAVGVGSADAAPAAAEAAPAPEPAAEPAAAAESAAEPVAAAASDSARGKEVYDAACFVCHTPGAAGAPKLGDAAAWGPRVEKGAETLYKNAINGYMGDNGMMPPKGGRPDFSDDDVKAAVDYMTANSK